MPDDLAEFAANVVKLACERRVTLVTVESCTAGGLVQLLAAAEGAGEAIEGGLVVYSKSTKTAVAGVPQELIAGHTAVSGEVASAMASGGLNHSPADIAVAITGVAGPAPDEDGNPVGLVFVAAAAKDGRRKVLRHEFGSSGKEQICALAMRSALVLLEEMLTTQLP